jgi:hypothetical protein
MANGWVGVMAALLLLAGCMNGGQSAEKPKAEQKQEQWTPSPVFETSTGSKAIGVKGKAGILVHEDNGLVVKEEVKKYMWLIWGDKEKLAKGTVEIYGTHQVDKKRQLLHKDSNLVNPLHGADAATLSGPTFPKKGRWKIDVMVNGKPHASFVLNVK